MRTTVVEYSYLMHEPLGDRVLSGFKIIAFEDYHSFILIKTYHGENGDTPKSHRSEG